MEQATNFIQIVQDMVLNPTLGSAFALFATSLLNEIIAIFPYAVVLAGQLLFLNEPLTLDLMLKLLVFVAIPVGVGSAIGVIPVYAITYFGGKPAINKFHKYLHFSWEEVEKVNRKFKGEWYDEILFLTLRTIPVLPSFPVSIVAGILRMRFMRYFLLTTLGFIIRMMLTLIVIGMGMQSLSQL